MSGAEKDASEKSVQDFLQRWSRRKLGVAEDAAPPAEPSQSGETQSASPPETAPEVPVAFDLTKLPPIESIDASTDIRAFLAPGVPVELTRAALRRAWTSDPAIRDFVGIAENQWDFTNPDAVPGFGSLEFSDEVRAMVSRLFGEAPQTASVSTQDGSDQSEREVVAQQASAGEALASPDAPRLSEPRADAPSQGGEEDHAAPQNDSRPEERQAAQRKHGAALPK